MLFVAVLLFNEVDPYTPITPLYYSIKNNKIKKMENNKTLNQVNIKIKTAEEILKEHVKPDWFHGGDAGRAIIAAMEEYAAQKVLEAYPVPCEPLKP